MFLALNACLGAAVILSLILLVLWLQEHKLIYARVKLTKKWSRRSATFFDMHIRSHPSVELLMTLHNISMLEWYFMLSSVP